MLDAKLSAVEARLIMHPLALAFLVAMAPQKQGIFNIHPSTINATCFGSPITESLGAGNIASTLSSVSTSVVNIWAFVDAREDAPIAWLFKDAIGDYYLQFSSRANPRSFRSIRHYWLYFHGPGPYVPTNVRSKQLVAIENILGARGIVRVSCFAHDYKM